MLGWGVLALVFVDEVLAVVAGIVWGSHAAGLWLGILTAGVVLVLWGTFASPRAPRGGPVVRPVVRVLVLGLACVALWASGHHVWGVALAVFSVVVNALSQLPSVRGLMAAEQARGRGDRGWPRSE